MPSQYPDAYSESDPLLKKKSDLASQFGADQKQELVQSQKPPEPAQQTLAPVQPMQQASMQKPATNTGNVQMQGPSTNMGANAMTPAAGGANGYKPPNPGGQAPSPTNFTNFGRYQSANQASSDAESQRLISGATDKANAAKAQLADLQRQFGAQVQGGSVGAYSGGGMPAGMTPAEQAAYKANPQAAYMLDRKYGGANGNMSAADMQAKANGTYSGPGGLGDVAGYQAAVDAAKAAQDNLDALKTPGGIQALEQQQNSAGNTGTSGFSAGLVGSAGQKGFQALRSQFNPAADTTKAETDAAAAADKAKSDSAANSSEWAKAAAKRAAIEGGRASAASKEPAPGEKTEEQKQTSDKAMKSAYEELMKGPSGNLKYQSWKDVTPAEKEAVLNGFEKGTAGPTTSYNGMQAHGFAASGLTRDQLKKAMDSLTDAEYVKLMSVTPDKAGKYLQAIVDDDYSSGYSSKKNKG